MNCNSSLKKAAKIILSVILIGITVINLLTVLFSSIGLRKQLNWVPCAFLSVTSDSMKPKFSKGDMILVWDTPYDELNIGDIVTYFDEQGGFTTHELIRRNGDEIITKGLANNTADNPVNRGLYCAKLIAVFPKLGFIVDIFTRPIPAVIAISLIIFLFYGLPLIKRVKDDKKHYVFLDEVQNILNKKALITKYQMDNAYNDVIQYLVYNSKIKQEIIDYFKTHPDKKMTLRIAKGEDAKQCMDTLNKFSMNNIGRNVFEYELVG